MIEQLPPSSSPKPSGRTRHIRKNLVIFSSLLAGLAVCWIAVQFIGPSGGPPLVDPLTAYLSQSVPANGNAADDYEAAAAALQPPSDESIYSLPFTSKATPPDSVVQWVSENVEAIDHLHRASRKSACVFPYQRQADGFLNYPNLRRMREFAKAVVVHAFVALDSDDLEGFLEDLGTLDALARHAERPLTAVNHLIVSVIRTQQHHAALMPLTRETLSVADRHRYARAALELLSPPPSLADAVAAERDESLFAMYAMLKDGPQLLIRGRTMGEIRRSCAIIEALANQSIAARLDSQSTARRQFDRLRNRPRPRGPAALLLNAPAVLAGMVIPSTDALFRVDAWLTTEHRGVRTVLRLFLHRAEFGAFPDSLQVLDSTDIIDPFTEKPFLYRRSGDRFTLYSAALDQDDDGGKHDPRCGLDPVANRRQKMVIPTGFEPTPLDADYVIWPPQQPTSPTTQPASAPSQP